MVPVLASENLAEIRSRKVIRIGFALVMLIIAFIVLFGIGRMSKVHETLSEIVAHEQVAIEMLFRMQQAARDRSVLLYSIASTKDPFERDEQVLQHGRFGGQFAEARIKLNTLQLDETERALLARLGEYTNNTQKLQGEVLEQLSNDRFQQAQDILNRQAVPSQSKILATINELLDYEISKSHSTELVIQKQQVQTRIFMVAGGVVAAIFAGLIATFINRRMGKLISGLETSAHQLQDANHSLESLRLAMDHHGIVSITDVHGNITFVNDKFCQISQYAREDLIGKNHRLINSGIHPSSFFEEMWNTIAAGKIWQGEICNRNRSGAPYWVSSTIVPFLDDAGLPCQYIAVRTDITAIKEAEQVLMRGKYELEALVHERTADLEEREEVLQSITTAAQDAVIMIDSNGNVTHWNPAAEKMFGYSLVEIIGRNLLDLVVPSKYHDALRAGYPKFVQTGTGPLIGAITEVDARKRDGSEFPVEISIAAIRVKQSWHAVAIARDITVRKLAAEHLKQLASTDALTGAFNRRRFNEVMQIELARAKRYGTPITLIIFDIDHFKRINDTHGHSAGDQVLLKLALLVSGNIRDTDIFARWGGEEFVILASNCETQCPHSLAEKIRKLIEFYPFEEVGQVTCSFGVTEYCSGDDQESIVKRADSNLYRAKEAGRNRVCFDETNSPQ
ncbi:MAG TPA: diguanylate cyclase [Gallionellaceae bacterium]|jgi:diguanylate cyclase (GGDEF)-like protein/PAS domain S-box-containing protein|nr:diguanylate cyclase [Gallionellaceae bacterium]HQS74008.1 diguanylate cyclase [Gallionellaceae bacterium]